MGPSARKVPYGITSFRPFFFNRRSITATSPPTNIPIKRATTTRGKPTTRPIKPANLTSPAPIPLGLIRSTIKKKAKPRAPPMIPFKMLTLKMLDSGMKRRLPRRQLMFPVNEHYYQEQTAVKSSNGKLSTQAEAPECQKEKDASENLNQ